MQYLVSNCDIKSRQICILFFWNIYFLYVSALDIRNE